MSILAGMKKWLIRVVLFLPAFISIYLLTASICMLIPINPGFEETDAEKGITIYVKSNGVHTDLVLPYRNEAFDWSAQIEQVDFFPNSARYVAFGWGDKGFYLETPTWADLKFKTAFKALFWLGSAAMHVTLYENMREDGLTRKVVINKTQYIRLVSYIQSSFKGGKGREPELIQGYHYTNANDNFYDAKGTYNFFYTCNSWTNGGLKHAGVRTAIWAPFEWSVMRWR